MKACNATEFNQMILDKMLTAMTVVHSKSEQDVQDEVLSFYSQGSPTIYKRTGKLGKSVKSHGVSKLNSRVDFYIWLDRTYNYTVPNPDFIERGFSSFFSTPMVFEKAEAGEANIKGKPGFWKRSKEKIEIDLNCTLAKHFKHK